MQISRHWRLNNVRYELKTSAYRGAERLVPIPSISGQFEAEADQIEAEKNPQGVLVVLYDECNQLYLTQNTNPAFIKNYSQNSYQGNRSSRLWSCVSDLKYGYESTVGTVGFAISDVFNTQGDWQRRQIQYEVSRLEFLTLRHLLIIDKHDQNEKNTAANLPLMNVVAAFLPSGSQLHKDLNKHGLWFNLGSLTYQLMYLQNQPPTDCDLDDNVCYKSFAPASLVAAGIFERELSSWPTRSTQQKVQVLVTSLVNDF